MVFLSSVSIVSGSTKKHITHNMTYMYNYLINNHHYTRLSTQGMAEAEAVLSRVRVWAATGPGSCHQSPPSRVRHQHQPPTLMQAHAVSLRQHPASCSTGRRTRNGKSKTCIQSTFTIFTPPHHQRPLQFVFCRPRAQSIDCVPAVPQEIYWLRI